MKLEDCGFTGNMRTCAIAGAIDSIGRVFLPRFEFRVCRAASPGDEKDGCWRIAPREYGWQQHRQDTSIGATKIRITR